MPVQMHKSECVRVAVLWRTKPANARSLYRIQKDMIKQRVVQPIGCLLAGHIEVGIMRNAQGRGYVYCYHKQGATLWTPHSDMMAALCGVEEGKIRWENESAGPTTHVQPAVPR